MSLVEKFSSAPKGRQTLTDSGGVTPAENGKGRETRYLFWPLILFFCFFFYKNRQRTNVKHGSEHAFEMPNCQGGRSRLG
ncbi:hypothetical protein I7I53_07540 [Histoplasma capsulatum var. duboisii H88]|uniref:Uncharacterized protein n=1 Tax=Ajellomyces capsulatus (strain H88) TaxID=544711 RepID=A0A8A1LJ76_AJEC8|nr:hypothetical protein I7I53_07540 [Histoplasma capsulatum var. duboisii H88]